MKPIKSQNEVIAVSDVKGWVHYWSVFEIVRTSSPIFWSSRYPRTTSVCPSYLLIIVVISTYHVDQLSFDHPDVHQIDFHYGTPLIIDPPILTNKMETL